jgi:hypothetical protein
MHFIITVILYFNYHGGARHPQNQSPRNIIEIQNIRIGPKTTDLPSLYTQSEPSAYVKNDRIEFLK